MTTSLRMLRLLSLLCRIEGLSLLLLLFVAMEGPLGPNGGPLAVMREEHDEVEATLVRLTEVTDAQQATELAAHLSEVAREHFAKEERMVFPMAEQLLGEETLLDLGAQWAAQRIPG